MTDIEALSARLGNLAARVDSPDGTLVVTASDIRACLGHIRTLSGAVEAERERCAEIAENYDTGEMSEYGAGMGSACRNIAAAIRSSLKEG